MPITPRPSLAELVQMYESGGLPAELARYHGSEDGGQSLFVQHCVTLHSGGQIDLIGLTSQLAFAELDGHRFLNAQHFYCEAIPTLSCRAFALMECCKVLVTKAGNDLMANQPNAAFRAWCRNNPSEGAAVIEAAKAGDDLAKQFVTFALEAANGAAEAIHFIKTYVDDRQLSGMKALSAVIFADDVSARQAVTTLEPFVSATNDDNVRANALLAAFDILARHNDPNAAQRLIASASQEPGSGALHGIARIVSRHQEMLNDLSLKMALVALEATDPEHGGTIEEIDSGLAKLLRTSNDAVALDFLTAKLRDPRVKLENFDSAARALTTGDQQRLYGAVVRWLLSGSMALCNSVSDLLGSRRERAFDATVRPLGLTSEQQVFLCHKVIGFLFVMPVICSSIIVSVLRGGTQDIEDGVVDLLFDPMLLNYNAARQYLRGIPSTDPAYAAVREALAKYDTFHAGVNAAGTIKELHPSEYQRDVIRHRMFDEMKDIRKQAEGKSVFINLVHRSTLLYGRRSLTYVRDADGSQRPIETNLKTFSTSYELPQLEAIDPVGLSYMLLSFRVEQLN